MTQPSVPSNESQQHTRVIATILGPAEKQALLWLAARMPPWVVPDTLTMVGLAASVIIFLGYALTMIDKAFLWLASVGFVLQWFGDSLDGTLARYRKIERPRYGFFVDHIIDTVSEGLIFLGLGISPFMRFDLALLALISYLCLSVYVYLATYVNGVFRISYARMGPTEARVLAILANTVVFFVGNLPLSFSLAGLQFAVTFYDLVAIAFTALATVLFIYHSISTAMLLSREDRLAAQARRRAERAARRAEKAARRQARLERRAQKSAGIASANFATSRLVGVPNTGPSAAREEPPSAPVEGAS